MSVLVQTGPKPATEARPVPFYGSLAEFLTAESLGAAVKKARAHGYTRMDAFSPVPVEGLAEALGRKRTRIPLVFLLGGIVGGVGGYFLQWFSMTIDYPYNIGGRPFHSWPMFIPITFELTILSASLCGLFGMLMLNGLPRLNHPLFKMRAFDRATTDRYFLCIEASDPVWNILATRTFLEGAGASAVTEVPA